MPIHIYWGEEQFFISRAVRQLQSQLLDEQWKNFNYTQYPPNSKESLNQALTDILSSPIVNGGRLVYLPNSTLLGACAKDLINQLERVLPQIPQTNFLLITSQTKPDARNKSVKLLLEHALVKEFPLTPLWQTDALIKQARSLATEIKVDLTTDACKLLVESTGNNTQLIFTELQKLKTFANGLIVNADIVNSLIINNAANSLQLAAAIRIGNVPLALELIASLLEHNEPGLKLVATLATSFRTWFIVKLCTNAGWDNSRIAQLAEVKNPKRLYFLRQEVANITAEKLQNIMQVLLVLELLLKNGEDEKYCLQTQIIKLCNL